jgi:hypothetical protein
MGASDRIARKIILRMGSRLFPMILSVYRKSRGRTGYFGVRGYDRALFGETCLAGGKRRHFAALKSFGRCLRASMHGFRHKPSAKPEQGPNSTVLGQNFGRRCENIHAFGEQALSTKNLIAMIAKKFLFWRKILRRENHRFARKSHEVVLKSRLWQMCSKLFTQDESVALVKRD